MSLGDAGVRQSVRGSCWWWGSSGIVRTRGTVRLGRDGTSIEAAGRSMRVAEHAPPATCVGVVLREWASQAVGSRRTALLRVSKATGRTRSSHRWGTFGVLFFMSLFLLCPHMGNAQYSFQVRFPDAENPDYLPYVDCGLTATEPLERMARSDLGACKECTEECTSEGINSPRCLCINSFDVATTEVNQFNGLDEDVLGEFR
jgi:hypothetical protein